MAKEKQAGRKSCGPFTVNVSITRTNENNPLPSYANSGDAGVDGYANIKERVVLPPNGSILIPLGIKCAIPSGYEIQIRPRSGLALKKGISILNSPGTIDSGFRDEIGAIMINHSNKVFIIEPGDRICQLVLNKYEIIEWVECDENHLGKSERGNTGFGDSGVK